jgi:hypothetical protein
MKKPRLCAVCGKDQAHKKVWEAWGKRVICMTCGPEWTFGSDKQPKKRIMQP